MIDELDPALTKVVGRASDYDGAIAAIKARVSEVGISYAKLDELAQLPEGWSGKTLGDGHVKQLSWRSFLAMIESLGMGCLFYVDPKLVEQMRPHWEKCDPVMRRTLRRAPIGKRTLERMMPDVTRELQRRSRESYRKLSAEKRSAIARKAGKASGRARARARLRKGIMGAEAARKAKARISPH
jgi:hypothetical protein